MLRFVVASFKSKNKGADKAYLNNFLLIITEIYLIYLY